jgi:F-type H+-transporting ATPase subunit delta
MAQNTVSAAIVEPYAEALMSVAQSHNLTAEVGNDVRGVLEVMASSADLKDLMLNPLVKPEAKKGILDRLLRSEIQPYFFNFLMLLVDRRRIYLLEAICKQYQTLLRKLNNTVLAEVTSTVDLNDGQRQAVVQKVREMTGAADVELETKIDPDLIGGVVIRVGSQVLDASIRGQLRRIGVSLLSTT